MNEEKSHPDKSRILSLYAAIGVSMIFGAISSLAAFFVSITIGVMALFACYRFRRNRKIGGYGENHATFIIRTVWITGLLILLMSIIGSGILAYFIHIDTLMPCLKTLADRVSEPDMMTLAHFAVAEGGLEPCMTDFMSANSDLFIIHTTISLRLPFVYALYRLTKGLVRANDSYIVQNYKSWF